MTFASFLRSFWKIYANCLEILRFSKIFPSEIWICRFILVTLWLELVILI